MCPSEADLYWDPPPLIPLTPAGTALVEKINELLPEKPRAFICALCYVEHANGLARAAEPEQERRSEKPS
jgi:hypothetical protein